MSWRPAGTSAASRPVGTARGRHPRPGPGIAGPPRLSTCRAGAVLAGRSGVHRPARGGPGGAVRGGSGGVGELQEFAAGALGVVGDVDVAVAGDGQAGGLVEYAAGV